MKNFGFPSKRGFMKVYRYSSLNIGRQTNKANIALTSNRLLAEYNNDQWICYASQTTQNQNYQVVDKMKVLKKLRFEIF